MVDGEVVRGSWFPSSLESWVVVLGLGLLLLLCIYLPIYLVLAYCKYLNYYLATCVFGVFLFVLVD